MTPFKWWKHRAANYHIHYRILSLQEQKACSHLLDLMKLTNTIKAILSEFSRGRCSKDLFCLTSEANLSTSTHPCASNTDWQTPEGEALLLGLVWSNLGSTLWPRHMRPPGHHGWTETLGPTTHCSTYGEHKWALRNKCKPQTPQL